MRIHNLALNDPPNNTQIRRDVKTASLSAAPPLGLSEHLSLRFLHLLSGPFGALVPRSPCFPDAHVRREGESGRGGKVPLSHPDRFRNSKLRLMVCWRGAIRAAVVLSVSLHCDWSSKDFHSTRVQTICFTGSNEHLPCCLNTVSGVPVGGGENRPTTMNRSSPTCW